MKITSEGINIHLEQEEISVFWNIIMFAKDYHNEKTNKGETCMYDNELKLANELLEITDKLK